MPVCPLITHKPTHCDKNNEMNTKRHSSISICSENSSLSVMDAGKK